MKKLLLISAFMIASTNLVSAEEIYDKAQPDYKANGARVGSFIFNPKLAVNQVYDDNIYSKQGDKIGDKITKFKPDLELNSDWNVHQLNFKAFGDFGRYWDRSSENYNDYTTAVNGKLEIMEKTNLVGSIDYIKEHEDRGTPDRNLSAKSPTKYNEINGKFGFERSLRRISLKIYETIKSLNFENNETNTGQIINNNIRDRNQYKTTGRIDYELEPRHGIFIESSKDIRRYTNKGTINRDSDGGEVRTGASLNITGKTKAEAYVGYLSQNYDSKDMKDINAFNFGASVLWAPTEIMLVKLAAGRSAEETSLINYSGYLSTAYTATIEYELLRNLLLVTDLTFAKNEYQSKSTVNRNDNFSTFNVGTKYFFNRNLLATLNYSNSRNSTNASTGSYLKNAIMVGLEIKF